MAPRFAGVPVEQGATAKPRFAGTPVGAAPVEQNPYLADLPVPGGGPGYVAPGGTPAPVDKPFNETVFAQGTSGVNEGIASVLGLPVDMTQGALRLGAAGINAATGSDIQLPVDAIGGSQSIKAAMAPTIRPESDDPANQVARRIGQEVGASIVPAAGVIAKSATPIRAALGQAGVATGSGAAAGVAQQVSDNPYVELAAQILGGGAVVGATQIGRKAVTPFPIDAERAAVNDVLSSEGIELTPGQMTGSDRLKYAESEIGGSGAASLTSRQAEQFTQAALSRAGISATKATPEVMAKAYDDIGQQFDDIAARNTLSGDQQLGADLGATWAEYTSLVNQSERAPLVENTLREIVEAVRTNGGTITGEAYKSMRSRLGRAVRRATDPELSGAIKGIQGALDDAMERSMAAANSPDLGSWQQVRSDYRNYLALVDAAGGAGENAAMGIISPAMLRQAVARQGKGSYVRGQGDFAELARAGVAGMSPLPNSGTAARMAVRGATSTIPAALGAVAGNDVAGSLGMLAGMGAGAFAPNALGAVMLSGPGRNYLTNQLLPRPVNVGQMAGAPALGGAANFIQGQQQQNALSALRARALN